MTINFFHCPVCGNVIVKVVDSGVVPSCCGRTMVRLEPHTAEQGVEKHLPVVTHVFDKPACPPAGGAGWADKEREKERCEATPDRPDVYRIDVGSVPHPMVEDHHVQFIAVSSGNGLQLRFLHGGDKPQACFSFCDADAPTATTDPTEVFEYCNIHGLWQYKMPKV